LIEPNSGVLRFGDTPDSSSGSSRWIEARSPRVVTLDRSPITEVSRIGEGDCYRYSILAPLDDQQGEWTLTVTELAGFDLVGQGEQTRLAGPWVFHFHVP
jgi:hypothetical protein